MPINHLSVEKLSKSFNEKVLLENVTFGIELGQKVALVGVNGCGKSTLLRILCGKDQPDAGDVSFQKDLKVAILEQSPDFPSDSTIGDAIFDAGDSRAEVLKQYHSLVGKDTLSELQKNKLQEVLLAIEDLGAWEYEYKVKEVLGKLGIHDLSLLIDHLSGGQKKRIALGVVLLQEPDFLILDEPTNHLDVDVIEWLENYLSTQNLSLIMVTHDRYFLDKVTTHILEIENQQLYQYEGNYGKYLEKKAEREEIAGKSKEKARNLMKKELEWIRRQPKARGTKAKYRVDAFEDVKKKANVSLHKAQMDIQSSERRMGKKVLEVKGLSKAFGENVIIENFSHVFTKGEKVGIVGKNGTGKSTFLKLLLGNIKLDKGEIDAGINTVFGYYQQSDPSFDDSKKVIEIVGDVAETMVLANGKTVTASQFLNLFLFPPAAQHDFASKLSGGEKRRLQLLMVLIRNPNFLILDEPTNDLDIITLNVLEDYIETFSGCVLIVTHDRYFLDRIVDHLFVFDDSPEIRDFPGNYTDFKLSGVDQLPPLATETREKAKKHKSPSRNKLSYKEQREFEKLEEEIPVLEDQKQSLINEMSEITDHLKLEKLGEKLGQLNNQLDEMEMRWLELSEMEGKA